MQKHTSLSGVCQSMVFIMMHMHIRADWSHFTTDINDAICMENSFAPNQQTWGFGLRHGFKSGPVMQRKKLQTWQPWGGVSLCRLSSGTSKSLLFSCRCCFLIRRKAFVLFHWTCLRSFSLTSDFFRSASRYVFTCREESVKWQCGWARQFSRAKTLVRPLFLLQFSVRNWHLDS